MKRAQIITMLVSVGIPLFIALLLFILAPSYMAFQFRRTWLLTGFELTLLLSAANVVFWVVLFRARNRRDARKSKVKNDEQKPLRFQFGLLFFVMSNFFVCMLPTIWIVVLYPAIVKLSGVN